METIIIDSKEHEVTEYARGLVWVQTDNGEKQVVRNSDQSFRFKFEADGTTLTKDPRSAS